MSVRTIDPDSVKLSVGGIPVSGYADGTFIEFERTTDSFEKSTGADGKTTRVAKNDRSGTCTITLQQSSPTNDQFTALAAIDERTKRGVVPIACKDLMGTSNHFSATGWIRKPAKGTFSKSVENTVWIIDMADYIPGVGGNF